MSTNFIKTEEKTITIYIFKKCFLLLLDIPFDFNIRSQDIIKI